MKLAFTWYKTSVLSFIQKKVIKLILLIFREGRIYKDLFQRVVHRMPYLITTACFG
jgi:hypothetical protein